MKRNRILTVSLLCILLASSILSLVVLPRIALAYKYANQFAGLKAKNGNGDGEMMLDMILYGDPEPARQIFGLFHI